VTLPVPVFVTVKACDVELPTNAFPKLRLLALEESKKDCVGRGAGFVPVPVRDIVTVPPQIMFVLTTICPLNATAASGRNVT
jgi:hypothetical protein